MTEDQPRRALREDENPIGWSRDESRARVVHPCGKPARRHQPQPWR